MKNQAPLHFGLAAILFTLCAALMAEEQGIYVQLHPNSDKKIIIQIVPDKTYKDVVAYVNFYSANNKRIAQESYDLSEAKNKFIRKGQCTNRTFKFSFHEKVTRVTIDRVIASEADGSKSDSIIDLPVSKTALGPIEK